MTDEWSSSPAQWVRDGSALFSRALSAVSDSELQDASLLPDWTRAHVTAHVAANAQAIGRLLHWAATGEPTAMYPSLAERDREIAERSSLPADQLCAWFSQSDLAMQSAMESMSRESWENIVVTAQGREVPARETLWMRSREVCIHAVDMHAGIEFDDLPDGFLLRLIDEAHVKHSSVEGCPAMVLQSDGGERWRVGGDGAEITVTGSLGSLAAWLTGRGANGVRDIEGAALPVLGKWL